MAIDAYCSAKWQGGQLSTELPLYDLHERHPGLTAHVAGCYEEAARVCFDRHHTSPIDLQIERDEHLDTATLAWAAVDNALQAAYANDLDTTELGAYAVVLAVTELLDGLVAVRRAEQRTGADYYVAPKGTEHDDLEDCIRLEISGSDAASEQELRARLARKVQQTIDGVSNLPAFAGVVGYKARQVLMSLVEDAA